MSKLPIIGQRRDITSARDDTKSGEPTVPETQRPVPFSAFPFFSFSYSFNEITLVDGQTRVRSRQARFVDGKLETEEFDGTASGDVYTNAVAESQRLLAEQTSFLLRQFSQFLPFWRK